MCICDAQRPSVTVHWERFKKEEENSEQNAVLLLFLFTLEKRLAHDIFETFSTRSALVLGATASATDFWAQGGSTHSHIFAASKHWWEMEWLSCKHLF